MYIHTPVYIVESFTSIPILQLSCLSSIPREGTSMSTFLPISPKFLHTNKSKHEYMFSMNLFQANALYTLLGTQLFFPSLLRIEYVLETTPHHYVIFLFFLFLFFTAAHFSIALCAIIYSTTPLLMYI